MKKENFVLPKDVKSRYLAGGMWKTRIFAKLGKGKSEKCKRPRIYVAIPPLSGWPGGHPKDNGCKHA
jgi:hypothetical protein